MQNISPGMTPPGKEKCARCAGSYGGYNFITADEGLLELMSEAVNGGDPVGWLTAVQVMKYVKGTGE